MERKHYRIACGILSAALVASLVWGGLQILGRRRAVRALEETYQSALAEAVDHLDGLNVKLEKLLLTGDRTALLSQISRQAGEAHSCLTLLPLSHQAMQAAIRFCAQVSDYAQTLIRQTVWSSRDEAQVNDLAAQAALLWGQMELSRQQMAQQALAFWQEERAFYLNAQGDQRPVEQLYDEEITYPTLIYDGAFSDAQHQGAPRGLPQGEVTQEEANALALAFVGEAALSAQAAPSAGGAIPAWGVTVQTKDAALNLEITRQGGKTLWMMPEHGDFEPLMTLETCREKAEAFLQSRGFGPMEPSHYQVYEGLATINFIPVQNSVLLYPDQVKVQCRLDTGEVVGLEANHYWMNHVPRGNLEPKLTETEARKRLSSKLEAEEGRLCLVPHLGGERLCWEFAGVYDGDEYRVYIDALTGQEAELLKILPTENGILTV